MRIAGRYVNRKTWLCIHMRLICVSVRLISFTGVTGGSLAVYPSGSLTLMEMKTSFTHPWVLWFGAREADPVVGTRPARDGTPSAGSTPLPYDVRVRPFYKTGDKWSAMMGQQGLSMKPATITSALDSKANRNIQINSMNLLKSAPWDMRSISQTWTESSPSIKENFKDIRHWKNPLVFRVRTPLMW